MRTRFVVLAVASAIASVLGAQSCTTKDNACDLPPLQDFRVNLSVDDLCAQEAANAIHAGFFFSNGGPVVVQLNDQARCRAICGDNSLDGCTLPNASVATYTSLYPNGPNQPTSDAASDASSDAGTDASSDAGDASASAHCPFAHAVGAQSMRCVEFDNSPRPSDCPVE